MGSTSQTSQTGPTGRTGREGGAVIADQASANNPLTGNGETCKYGCKPVR